MDQCQHIKLLTCFIFWPNSFIFSATWGKLSLLIAPDSPKALGKHISPFSQEINRHAVNNIFLNEIWSEKTGFNKAGFFTVNLQIAFNLLYGVTILLEWKHLGSVLHVYLKINSYWMNCLIQQGKTLCLYHLSGRRQVGHHCGVSGSRDVVQV